MTIHRRTLMAMMGVAATLPLAGRAVAASAQDPLRINVPGNTLGVHVPYMAAINEILPELGYPAAEWERVPKLQTITQSILSGQVDVGAGDAISTLRAVEAGANLKIIGNAFMHTSLVFVVNADKIDVPADLTKPDVTIAVNSTGDFTHVMVVGPMTAAGVDMEQVNLITMGGSGNRMRALLAGKVDGVPLHFDQASELISQGNFKVLIEPAKEYEAFLGEVWIVSGEWLAEPANRERAKALLKATLMSFRKANEDPAWYADKYRRYGTDDGMATATDEAIEVVRQALGVDIGTWPDDMAHRLDVYEALLPVYEAAGAVEGTVDLTEVVDTTLLAEVLSEMS